jgi:osmotically inducible protein OsmC
VKTTASVHLGKDDKGFKITRIDLDVTAAVPGVDAATFQTHAEQTKTGCIISRALEANEITLKATLV